MDASVSAGAAVAAEAMEFDLRGWSQGHLDAVEEALGRWVRPEAPAGLGEAMRYAVLDGGKRLRPLLALAACEATGGDLRAGMRAAGAVELIHAYSLVHDDMPCMDDDSMRRGKPTVHVRFGQALALLAGDALQALAFEVLTPGDGSVAPTVQADLCRLLATAAGDRGMAGGQAIDLAHTGKALDEAALRQMHALKTGALLRASVLMGMACANAVSAATREALDTYATSIGIAFQVVDDILDVTADSGTLGKTAGKDAAQGKPTYVSVLGLEPSRAMARTLLGQALAALDTSALRDTAALRALAHQVVRRSN